MRPVGRAFSGEVGPREPGAAALRASRLGKACEVVVAVHADGVGAGAPVEQVRRARPVVAHLEVVCGTGERVGEGIQTNGAGEVLTCEVGEGMGRGLWRRLWTPAVYGTLRR